LTNVLEMRNITKRFPGIVANDRVNLELRQGEIHVLLGENGAGKTTLMNILYGFLQPDEGEIIINGKPVSMHSPLDALTHGIGMVHQHFMLVPNMTVAENVVIGKEPTRGPLLQMEHVTRQLEQLSQDFGLNLDPRRYIWQLSVGEQQRVEILKVLYRGADILILDEPTSVLTPPEVERLFEILKSLIKSGKSIIFITHKLNEITSISHRVTVMRRGQVQGTVETCAIDKKQLANMLVGRDVVFSTARQATGSGAVVASLQHLRVMGDHLKAAVDNFSLDLHAGEIVGIAGVDGNGQSELAEAITGLRPINAGCLMIRDQDLTHSPTRKRIDLGLMYVPADRKARGVALDLSVAENLVMKNHRTAPYSVRGILQPSTIRQFAVRLVKQYDIRCNSIDTLAGTLSGGNIQKLLLARETAEKPYLLVAEHPTRGLDIGATEYVRELLLDKRDQGTAILLISADLDEVLELSDRVIVMYEGAIVHQCRHAEIDREKIGLAMAGMKL
jgi:general nucleoside transport system ATP-binding protein